MPGARSVPKDTDEPRGSAGISRAEPWLVRAHAFAPVLMRPIATSPMRYLAAAGFGVLTAIATAILWIVVGFVLPVAVPSFLSWAGATRFGAGGAGAVIGSGSILAAALLGFVGGLAWMLWRR